MESKSENQISEDINPRILLNKYESELNELNLKIANFDNEINLLKSLISNQEDTVLEKEICSVEKKLTDCQSLLNKLITLHKNYLNLTKHSESSSSTVLTSNAKIKLIERLKNDVAGKNINLLTQYLNQLYFLLSKEKADKSINLGKRSIIIGFISIFIGVGLSLKSSTDFNNATEKNMANFKSLKELSTKSNEKIRDIESFLKDSNELKEVMIPIDSINRYYKKYIVIERIPIDSTNMN